MANTIIRVLPRSLYNFTNLAAGGSVLQTLAQNIDVREFTEITAYVRLHPGTFIGQTPQLAQVQVVADGITDQDPAALTGTQTPFGIAFQVFLASAGFAGTTAPIMKTIAVPQFGSTIAIALVLLANATLTSTLQYIISVDLVCKNRDPGPDYFEEREPLLSNVMD